MTWALTYFKATLVGGAVFLVPIVLLIAILKQAYQIVHPPIGAAAHAIAGASHIGPVAAEIATVVLLALMCLGAGLASTTLLAQGIVRTLEAAILSKIPGYELIKDAGEQLVGYQKDSTHRVVLASIEDSLQIGFLVEEIDDGHAAVIIPNVPSPWSGTLYIMSRDRFSVTDIGLADAIECLKRGGLGSADLLRGKLRYTAVTAA